MEWEKLVSEVRVPAYKSDLEYKVTLSAAFNSDYRRVVKSDSFRRLQDKTQVFPLERNDFVRTRLTHSLEVAMLTRDILFEVIENWSADEADLFYLKESYRLLETASLIHDIGNPPFGHFGEDAIRIWFKRNGSKLKGWNKLTTQQKNDFLVFEGNAQTIRLLTKLHDYNGSSANGMRLTASTLDSVIKYTSNASQLNKSILTQKKIGYFYSETEVFRKIKEVTGTGSSRHPLVFLLEAADDISYTFSDFEDGYNYGLYSLEEVKKDLEGRMGCPINSLNCEADENEKVVVQSFIRKMQTQVYKNASNSFRKNYKEIMIGTFDKDLMSEPIWENKLFKALQEFACEHIFNEREIFDQEVLGFNIMSRLLDEFVPVVLKYKSDETMNKYEERIFDNIPESAKKLYQQEVKNCKDEHEKNYYRLKIAVDFVCNMTDGYARKLHDTLFK